MFEPAPSPIFAHHAHLVALSASDNEPDRAAALHAYARQDATLRRTARPPAEPFYVAPSAEDGAAESDGTDDGRRAVEASSLEAALEADRPPDLDREWFDRRWSLGEADAARTTVERACRDMAAYGADALLPNVPVAVRFASCLGSRAVVSDDGLAVGIGPRTEPLLALLGCIGARLWPRPGVDDAVPHLRWLLRTHLGGTALLRMAQLQAAPDASDDAQGLHVAPSLPHAPDKEAATADLVRVATEVLIPDHAAARRLALAVDELGKVRYLDQAPGEIARIRLGIEKRRPERLHRAWRRGFFLPRGLGADALEPVAPG